MFTRRTSIFPFGILLIVGILITLSGCGWGTGSQLSRQGSEPPGKPGKVRIEIDLHAPNQAKPTVTATTAATVQQLYTTIYTLAGIPQNQACTDELGPHYTLTFYDGGKTLATMKAERDGCRPVMIQGEAQPRRGTEAFWNLLDRAIYEASPPAHPQQVAILHTLNGEAPQSAHITSVETTQRLYDAILKLPLATDKSAMACADHPDPEYQLVFQAADQAIPSSLNISCNTISLSGDYRSRGGTYQTNEQFKQLFAEILAGTTFTPARPDQLALTLVDGDTSQQRIIDDAELMSSLYDKARALPAGESQTNCPSAEDKMAGKGKYYTFKFSQWGLAILDLEAYEGSCQWVMISPNGGARQGDQAFWDLIHQATGKQ